ncbi:membrane protein insertase YidC [Campylobacter sp. FMV-PI01]|uniref:Membrane protein insertase YidC n=1 Tax=Campylobacter portucalensis TaxID=2608384 RepID=A0A6L5WI25_9BACT|nr:membrane protein insertase YidC [Campylobacter portucalensis]MSN96112.1 membrane protein insertase YidC [Campylobacter portucalensis]
MLDEKSIQKRAVVAILLAFIFFLGYDHFYLSKFRDTNQTIQTNKAPSVEASQTKPIIEDRLKERSNITIANVKSDIFDLKIDEFGRISSFMLKENIYKNEDGEFTNLIDPTLNLMPLEIRFSDPKLNDLAFKTKYEASVDELDVTSKPKTITLTQNLGELTITKIIKFYPTGNYELDVKLSKPVSYFITPGARSNVAVDGYTVHGVLLRDFNDKSLEIIEDSDLKNETKRYHNVDIASAFDRYYATLFYNFEKPFNVVLTSQNKTINQTFIEANGDFKIYGYIGPKNHKILNDINKELIDIIEYGWFTFIAKPIFWLLSAIYNYVGNWGWAIVLLTILIKIILAYPTYKGMVSMNRLKDLAPKMKEIQQKYKDDKAKMQIHIMELYKKHGANPMGGCLPILMQIPIFFAMYRVLLNAIELQGAAWILWIDNLAIKDPYFILPAIMGLSMFIQQKITPTTFADPMQEKIMKFLPLIFVFFFVTFPAGLTLYWCVNNIISVIQQYIVNRIFKSKKALNEGNKQ